MDDSEHVCPLCCEELDISDRQFFPCKCGYQVCMWCWHRIRESESGLCPACRTPYGDDPHEFSAVDVEEVLRANKEKEAAAKRERDRQRHENSYSHIGASSSHGSGGSSLDDNYSSLSGPGGPMEVPKDRTQLANMRVIRRNLVYAVGLPPTVANEDTLRKSEYFGQYGKISKIVLNRNQASNAGGDPRRSSCSAYVTFFHKEDTLACILALDGFYLENRNIRASYGTSKYCSAFIKNVRCNNPDCTYLHEMGAVEDTFTKQEIQAGYVTSGRDVLARQQQIVAQALSATSTGSSGSSVRKKSGGGGPSGTGRSCASGVFPPPEFDEPAKQSPTVIPNPTAMVRSATAGTGFSAAAASAPGAAKLARSSSTGANVKSVGVTSAASVVSGNRKGFLASNGSVPQAPQATTAASVVAGVHTISSSTSEPPAPHTTLTPLTPLKRSIKSTAAASKSSSSASMASATVGLAADSNSTAPELPTAMPASKGLTHPGQSSMAAITRQQNEVNKLSVLKSNPGGVKKANIGRSGTSHGTIGPTQVTAPVSPSSLSSSNAPSTNTSGSRLSSLNQNDSVVSSLGGEVISSIGRPGGGQHVGAIGSAVGSFGSGAVASNNFLDNKNVLTGGLTPGGLDSLGGEVFTGPLNPPSGKSAIGSGKDKWNASGAGLAPMPTTFDAVGRGVETGAAVRAGVGPGALWGGANAGPPTGVPGRAFGATNVGNVGGAGVPSSAVGPGSVIGTGVVSGFGGVDSLAGTGVGAVGGFGGVSGIGGVGAVGSAGVGGVGNVGSIFGGSGGAISAPNGIAVGGINNNINNNPNISVNTNATGNITRGGSSIGSVGNSGGIIGSHVAGSVLSGDNRFGGPPPSCGSSALASILGINLPTGSGSLRESSSLWNSSSGAPSHPQSSPMSTLKNGPLSPSQGVIGPSSGTSNSNALIGGVPIVGGVSQSGAFGGSNKNDIALLQSLLPGVHITSGNESSRGFGAWGSAPAVADVGVHQVNPRSGVSGETWDHMQSSGGPTVGAVGQNNGQQPQRQGAGNIW